MQHFHPSFPSDLTRFPAFLPATFKPWFKSSTLKNRKMMKNGRNFTNNAHFAHLNLRKTAINSIHVKQTIAKKT
jgi:hypothetical protein